MKFTFWHKYDFHNNFIPTNFNQDEGYKKDLFIEFYNE